MDARSAYLDDLRRQPRTGEQGARKIAQFGGRIAQAAVQLCIQALEYPGRIVFSMARKRHTARLDESSTGQGGRHHLQEERQQRMRRLRERDGRDAAREPGRRRGPKKLMQLRTTSPQWCESAACAVPHQVLPRI